MEKVARVRRENLSSQVYASLRRLIVTRSIPPGERLVQNELAAQFGTSRIPVRDALLRLESEGFLHAERESGGTFCVSDIDLEELRLIYELRALVEPFIAARSLRSITADQVRELEKLHAEAALAAESNEPEAYLELNTRFHSLLYANVGDRTEKLIRGLWAGVPLTTPLSVPNQMEHSQVEHAQILDAVRAKDAQRLQAALRSHIEDSGHRLERFHHELQARESSDAPRRGAR